MSKYVFRCRLSSPLPRAAIRAAVLAALPDYQWPPCGTLMTFAISIGYSDSCVRTVLNDLIAEGLVERVEDGRVRGRPRYVWRLRPMILCVVRPCLVGWWVEFPQNLQAVLLLDSDGEKIQFAKDCGIDLEGRELLLAAEDIHQCPESYYLQAQIYPDVPF